MKQRINEFPLVCRDQQGAVLIMVIISILILASIGTAVFQSSSTSTHLSIASVHTYDAYYLAETGKNFAMHVIGPEIDDHKNPNYSGRSIDLFDGNTYTLPSDFGQFKLELSSPGSYYCGGYTCYKYRLIVTGMPTNSAKRSITYDLNWP